jgi:hypothetical protein
MKLVVYLLVIACMFEAVCGDGLRGRSDSDNIENRGVKEDVAKEKPVINLGSLSLNDEFAPSFSPTTQIADSPTISPTLAPSAVHSPSAALSSAPTASTAPSSAPSKLVIKSETYSGGEPSGKSFRIDIRFDNKFSQNAWHLFQGSGSQKKALYSQDFGKIGVGGLHSTIFTGMPMGVYTFVIADIGNDGISGGRIAIYKVAENQADTLIWEEQGNFGFLSEKAFLIQ